MKAVPEKDDAGRTIWRVKFSVAQRRVRKTFHSEDDANTWIANNRTIAVDEGRIFWEAWNAIDPRERHEVMDALRLMREFRVKHPASKLTLVESARKQIAKAEAIEKSLTFQAAVDRFLETKVNRKRKGSVSEGWLKVLDPCLRRVARELPNKTLVEFPTEEIEEYLDDQDWSPRTFNNYRDYLNSLFKWAAEKKYVQENPVKEIEKFAKKFITKEVIVPSVQTVGRILKLAQNEKYRHLQPALDLGFGFAMRSSEISGMLRENITPEVIHVPASIAKSGQARNISPSPLLAGVFESLLSAKGTGLIMRDGWRRELTNLFEEAGLGKPRNIMRKSGGSYHFHATSNEALTREIMGHTEDSQIFTSSYKALRFGDAASKTPISQADGAAYYQSWQC